MVPLSQHRIARVAVAGHVGGLRPVGKAAQAQHDVVCEKRRRIVRRVSAVRVRRSIEHKTLTLHRIVQVGRVEVARLLRLQDVGDARSRAVRIERPVRRRRTEKDELAVGRAGGHTRIGQHGGEHHLLGLRLFAFHLLLSRNYTTSIRSAGRVDRARACSMPKQITILLLIS